MAIFGGVEYPILLEHAKKLRDREGADVHRLALPTHAHGSVNHQKLKNCSNSLRIFFDVYRFC